MTSVHREESSSVLKEQSNSKPSLQSKAQLNQTDKFGNVMQSSKITEEKHVTLNAPTFKSASDKQVTSNTPNSNYREKGKLLALLYILVAFLLFH